MQKGVREEQEEEVGAKVRAKGRQQEYERRGPNIEWCAAMLVRCFPGPPTEIGVGLVPYPTDKGNKLGGKGPGGA